MSKVTMGPQIMLYPMPTVLVGANVGDKPNFMAVAWCGVVSSTPPMLSVAIRPQRYTLKGIRQNMAFSVNVPSCEQVKEADYCGIVSGTKADKAAACKFDVFYGKLNNAPLVEQCPVNMECTVEHILNLGSHSLVIGKIAESHVTESCLTDGKPDVAKLNPFIFTPQHQYYAFGDVIAKAFSCGRELKTG